LGRCCLNDTNNKSFLAQTHAAVLGKIKMIGTVVPCGRQSSRTDVRAWREKPTASDASNDQLRFDRDARAGKMQCEPNI
jgi:hypothetical protein